MALSGVISSGAHVHLKRHVHVMPTILCGRFREKRRKKPVSTPPKINPPKVLQENLNMRTDKFDISELRIVIETLKRNKAPGPDKHDRLKQRMC